MPGFHKNLTGLAQKKLDFFCAFGYDIPVSTQKKRVLTNTVDTCGSGPQSKYSTLEAQT